jgi:putative ATP-dependent endonuclease of the OLD family
MKGSDYEEMIGLFIGCVRILDHGRREMRPASKRDSKTGLNLWYVLRSILEPAILAIAYCFSDTLMKITSLKVSNFRCFGPEPVQMDFERFTSLIGANGAGKSAVLHALIRLFGSRQNERSLSRADFHIPPGIDADTVPEVSLWIEAKLEFPKLISDPNDPSVPDCFRHMIVEAPGEVPFCRVRLEGTWRRTAQAEGVVDEDLWWIVSAADTPSENDKQKMSNYDRSRIQVIYVPASRDPSSQLRQAAGSLLHPILKANSLE